MGVNRCGEPENQSPINLFQPLGTYGWIYGEVLPFEHENLVVHFLDPKKDSKLFYERKNLQMAVDQFSENAEDKNSYYQTDFLINLYYGHTNQYAASSFHFHHPTEHTINGKHSDISFHLVLKASN